MTKKKAKFYLVALLIFEVSAILLVRSIGWIGFAGVFLFVFANNIGRSK